MTYRKHLFLALCLLITGLSGWGKQLSADSGVQAAPAPQLAEKPGSEPLAPTPVPTVTPTPLPPPEDCSLTDVQPLWNPELNNCKEEKICPKQPGDYNSYFSENREYEDLCLARECCDLHLITPTPTATPTTTPTPAPPKDCSLVDLDAALTEGKDNCKEQKLCPKHPADVTPWLGEYGHLVYACQERDCCPVISGTPTPPVIPAPTPTASRPIATLNCADGVGIDVRETDPQVCLEAQRTLTTFLCYLADGDTESAHAFVLPQTVSSGDPKGGIMTGMPVDLRTLKLEATRSPRQKYQQPRIRNCAQSRDRCNCDLNMTWYENGIQYGDNDVPSMVYHNGRWYVENPIHIVR